MANKNAEIIKKALEVYDIFPGFFKDDFRKRYPVLLAYSQNKKIEIQNSRGWVTEEYNGPYTFSIDPEKYRIADETITITHEGKRLKIDLTKAKEMGLIKEVDNE